jgi:MFS family permease
MIVPMSITSVHMKSHQHPLAAVSLVISAHTLGMYAFSILSGRMTDRWGRGPVIILGSILLILSCLLAAPSTRLLPLMMALFLLGLGWNFAYVAGSTLLSDQLSPRDSMTCCSIWHRLPARSGAGWSMPAAVLGSWD